MIEGTRTERLRSGVKGLDDVLHGGLPAGRIYLVHGDAGTGKTTLGLQFLMAGAAEGKRCLGITLLQTLLELQDVVASHRWDTNGITMTELPHEIREAATTGQTVFTTADVELSEVTDAIAAAVREHDPECLFIDSVSELGVLVETGYQMRRQLLKLKQLLDSISCTTLLSSGFAGRLDNGTLETLVHGTIRLEMKSPEFGRPRRRVLVTKMRGIDFLGGYHDADIHTGGLHVYPRILTRVVPPGARHTVSSGNAGMDALLGGGMQKGTACLISGTSGAGKSALSCLFAYSAAGRGVASSMFCFDERIETLLQRSAALGMPLEEHLSSGLVRIHQVDAGKTSPGHLAHMICHAVERNNVQIVVLDSLSGYYQSMPGERELTTQLHEVLGYLSSAGVLSIMILASHGLFGETSSPLDISYIADTVIVLRNFECGGEVRRCIAVLKKRYGDHEHTIREMQLGATGIRIGEPLSGFSGVLTGLPHYTGGPARLMKSDGSPVAGQENR